MLCSVESQKAAIHSENEGVEGLRAGGGDDCVSGRSCEVAGDCDHSEGVRGASRRRLSRCGSLEQRYKRGNWDEF